MEASRLNIRREKAPTIVLQNYMFFSEVGEKGSADVELEIVGQKIEPDGEGNEVIKYVIEVVSIKKINDQGARIA